MLNTWHALQIRTHDNSRLKSVILVCDVCQFDIARGKGTSVFAGSILCAAYCCNDGVEVQHPTLVLKYHSLTIGLLVFFVLSFLWF